MATGSYSPQRQLPPLMYKTVNTTTWGSTANTCTITDEYIQPNSTVIVQVTGTTPAAGRWSYTVTSGSVAITSSDAESSTLPIAYIVL